MRSPQLLLSSLLLVAWAALNAIWISQDKQLQDGDEMGHVGAAELYLEDLNQGQPRAFLSRTVSPEMGDYPPAYAASTGLWWWAMQKALTTVAQLVYCLVHCLVMQKAHCLAHQMERCLVVLMALLMAGHLVS